MNILKIYHLPDLVGGSERSMHLAAQELRRTGHRVYLLHKQATPPMATDVYCDHRSHPSIFSRDVLDKADVASVLEGLIAEWGIDVVHIHDFPSIRALKWLKAHCPTVISIHVPICPNGARYWWKQRACCARTVGFGCLSVGYLKHDCGRLSSGKRWSLRGFIKSMFEKWQQRNFLRQFPFVIANSTWSGEQLIQEGVIRSNIRVIPPPIQAVGSLKAARPPEPPVIVFTGRLVDFKGADQLLRASLEIRQDHRIWIIGEGPMESALRELAAKLGIAERVTFFGNIEGRKLDELRAQATIAVVPSLSPETFGLVGPEAMELGLPVIGYHVGGISQWLVDGECGVLVQPGDFVKFGQEISQLLDDPHRLETMRKRCRALAQQYYVTEHVRKLEDIYKDATTAVRWLAREKVGGILRRSSTTAMFIAGSVTGC